MIQVHLDVIFIWEVLGNTTGLDCGRLGVANQRLYLQMHFSNLQKIFIYLFSNLACYCHLLHLRRIVFWMLERKLISLYITKKKTIFFKTTNIYLFLAVLGLRCCVGFSLIVGSRGYPLVAAHRLLIAVASLVEHGL